MLTLLKLPVLASLALGAALFVGLPLAAAQIAPPTPPAPGTILVGPNVTTTQPAIIRSTEPLDGRPIARVDVVGVVRTDPRSILDQVRAQPGQNYTRNQVDLDVRTIAQTDKFVTVQAEVVPTADGRVIIRYVVQERALVANVEIVGNRNKTLDEIRELISVRAGGSIDPFIIQTDIKAIEDLYRKDGYNSVHVEVDQEALKKDSLVRYRIAEGPRARVWHVAFEGNQNITTRYLKWKTRTKSYIWIFRKGILEEDTVEADISTIREVYVSDGYLDARVSKSIEYNADKTQITVRFIINEGPRYIVGKLTLQGNTVFPTAELLADAPLHSGDFIQRDRAELLQKHIEDRYGHEGYIYRTVDMHTSYTSQPNVVDVNFVINEGESYNVGNIIVRGNPTIQERVIRRQIRVYPDQTFDMVLVRKSIERLKATRLFADVKVTPLPTPGNEQGVRDLLMETQEAQSGRFLVGAGVSTNSGLVGQISLEQQNFDALNPPRSWGEFFRGQGWKGAGQYFRILLEPGTEFQRYRVTFEEPYLFDTPYSFGNDAYYFTRARESWDERRIGDIVTLGRRFGDVWSATLSFRAEQVSISNASDFGGDLVSESGTAIDPTSGLTYNYSDSPQQVLDQVGSHFLTSIKPAIVRDTTDSRIFPAAGTRTILGWEQYGAMGGEVTMSKLTASFNWYYTLYSDLFDRKTVFSLRNEADFIPIGTSPFYERFYGGGIGSLRGFKFRGVSPRSGPPANPLQDPVGGDFSWVSTAEVNYPIYEEIVRGVVFVDVGDVESDITIGTIRSDAGAGIRLTIPFLGKIPLALDFAVPVSKATGDKTQYISFSLGIPF